MLIAEHSMCQPGRPSPIDVDHDGSPGFGPFQSAKSRTSSLRVFVGLDALADPQLLRIEARQPAIRRPRRDPEEDRAVIGPIRVPAFEQRLDQARRSRSMCSVARGRTSGRVMRSVSASARNRAR